MNGRFSDVASASAIIARYHQSYRNLPRAAWSVAAVVLIHNSGRMVSTFLAVYLFSALSLSQEWIGIAVTAYGSGAVIGSLLGGRLTTRLRSKLIILVSLLALGFGYLLLSILREPSAFTSALFISAVFDGMLRPAIMLVLMEASKPEDRPRCYALYQTSLNLGYAFGAIVGGILAEIHFPAIFWVNGAASILAGVVLIFVMEPGCRPRSRGGKNAPIPAPAPLGRNWPLIALCCVGFLYYCVSYQRLSIYPLYLTTDYGLTPSEFGSLLMFNGLLTVAAGVLITDRLKQIDQRLVAAAGTLFMCGSFAILPAGQSLVFAFFACVLLTLGEILFLPSVVTLVYSWSRSELAGQSMGAFFAIGTACRALGPMAGVWSFSFVGPTGTWLLCGIAGCLSAAFLVGLPKRSSQPQPEAA